MKDESGSFYKELMEVLKEANKRRAKDEQISFRQAVVYGLVDDAGSQLGDSFTTKIRGGLYKPTIERLLNLSKFLGVHPSRFAVYRERFGRKLLEENAQMIEMVGLLSRQPDEVVDILLQDAVKRMQQVIDKASPRKSAA